MTMLPHCICLREPKYIFLCSTHWCDTKSHSGHPRCSTIIVIQKGLVSSVLPRRVCRHASDLYIFITLLYSWDVIRQTANVTDAQLKARFCATALYHTLILILPTIASASPNESLPEGFDLDPSQCLPVPLMPETSSRFPGMPVEIVGELARDFRAESSVVEKMKLEDVYFRVRELAMEELGYEMR